MSWITAARRWLGENNHLVQAWVWIVLGIPTIIWWKDSILWVSLMSLYANSEASFAAHNAKHQKSPGQNEIDIRALIRLIDEYRESERGRNHASY